MSQIWNSRLKLRTSAIFVQDIMDIGAVAAGNDELLQLLGSRKIAKIAIFCPISRPASSELHQIFNDASILAILRLPRRCKSALFPAATAPRSTMSCTNIPDVCRFRPLFQICDILCYRAFRYITISLCYFCFRWQSACCLAVIMPALWNRAGHYIFVLWFLSSIFYLLLSFFRA